MLLLPAEERRSRYSRPANAAATLADIRCKDVGVGTIEGFETDTSVWTAPRVSGCMQDAEACR